ncbi:MAG: DUF3108 domain-containing protein [Gammaproteobacteria bacterium]
MPKMSPAKFFKLFFILALSMLSSHVRADALLDFTAVYKVEKYDSDIGRTTYQLEQDAGSAHFSMRTELTGFFALFRKDRIKEDSWLNLSNGELQLQRYSYIHEGSKRDRNTQLSIQWPAEPGDGVASGSHAGKAITFNVGANVRDALSFQLSLMRDAARNNEVMDYAVLSKDELKHYTFKRAGTDTLTIGGRDITTLVVERQSGERTTRLWLAPEYQYTPVKIELIEDDDSDTLMRIDTLTLNGKRVL